jgi:hypothetical protein
MLRLIVKSRQLTDVQPWPSKDANMTLVAVPGPESRSVTHRGWKTLLRNSANNMLTRPRFDVPRANFANNHCLTVLRRSLLPVAADLVLVSWTRGNGRRSVVNQKEALAFVERHGVVLQAARGPLPNLAEGDCRRSHPGQLVGHSKRDRDLARYGGDLRESQRPRLQAG